MHHGFQHAQRSMDHIMAVQIKCDFLSQHMSDLQGIEVQAGSRLRTAQCFWIMLANVSKVELREQKPH